MWRLSVAFLLLLPLEPASAAQQWLKITTPNFEMYTSAGEGSAKRAILHFERVRSFFTQQMVRGEADSDRVLIVAFRNLREFQPFQRQERSVAFYLKDRDRDQIVMGGFGEQFEQTAVHEFVHLLVARDQLEIPLWLNEGLAEIYSNLTPQGNNVVVGSALAGRAAALHRYKWLPLETLAAVDHSSPYYNEGDKTAIFYAQSWLLTHMLVLSDDYRQGFVRLMDSLAQGGGAEEVFRDVYGKNLDQVEKDLRLYFNDTVHVAVFPVKLEKSAEQPVVEPVETLDTDLLQAKLLARLRKFEEADKRFAEYVRQRPDDWRAEEALGYRYWIANDVEQARPHFARAVELGSENPLMHYEYSMLARQAGAEDEEVIPLLERALELNPLHINARLALAQLWVAEQDYDAALRHYDQIQSVTREQAVRLYHGIALAYAGKGDLAVASEGAQKAEQHAQTDEEKSRVADLTNYIGRLREREQRLREMTQRAYTAPPPTSAPVAEAGRRPVERPAVETVVQPSRPAVETVRIEGTLQSLDCLGARARLNVYVDGTLRSLAIYDPTQVDLRGNGGRNVELSCGQQKLTPVAVEFEPRIDDELGTIGAVRVLEFQ